MKDQVENTKQHRLGAPHDCTQPKSVMLPSASSESGPDPDDFGLGRPGSQEARRDRGPYFVRYPFSRK